MSEQVIEHEQRVEGRRRWVWWVLIALAVLLPLLVVFAAFRVGVSWRVAAALEQVRAAGYPATARELDDWYEAVPADQNAALVILEGAGRIRWPTDEAIREHLPFVRGGAEMPAPAEPLPERMRREIEAVVADHADALARLHEGAAMGCARYPVNLSAGLLPDLPHHEPLRTAARLLALEAVAHAEAGDSAAAAESIRSLLGLADSLRDKPMLISHVVRIAIQSLAVGVTERVVHRVSLDELLLIELAEAFAAADQPGAFTRTMIGKRAWMNEAIAREYRDEPVFAAHRWVGLAALDRLLYLEVMERVIAATQQSAHGRLEAIDAAMTRLNEASSFYTVMTDIAMPTLDYAVLSDLRTVAQIRVAYAALAAERYRHANGQLPESLDDLVPELLDVVPLDPFTGDPLKYRRLDVGYTVYSVGEDGTDHGGRRLSAAGRPFEPGADVPFTVVRE